MTLLKKVFFHHKDTKDTKTELMLTHIATARDRLENSSQCEEVLAMKQIAKPS